MIRMVILIVVACLSTVGGVYAAVSWKSASKAAAAAGEQSKLQTNKTRIVSVPLISNGEVTGYIVTRLDFTADPDAIKGTSIQPEGFVADEAFRTIYESAPADIKGGHKQILKTLSSNIAASVNKRLGREVVKDVLIDTWTYLTKQDMAKINRK